MINYELLPKLDIKDSVVNDASSSTWKSVSINDYANFVFIRCTQTGGVEELNLIPIKVLENYTASSPMCIRSGTSIVCQIFATSEYIEWYNWGDNITTSLYQL